MYEKGLWVHFFRFYMRAEYLVNNTTGTVYYQLKIGMCITPVLLLRSHMHFLYNTNSLLILGIVPLY